MNTTGRTTKLSTTWNYRLIRMDVAYPNTPWYEVHEVYYDEHGKPTYWTENPVTVSGESKKDVMSALLLMALDTERRKALKESELPGA